MAANETILSDIVDLLKKHPRGLPVKEIADEIGMNRMSVARHLDVMRSSGQLDMIQFGHAKIYSLSNRVPVFEMLNYSSDCIIILNQNKRINFANSNFMKLIDKNEDEIKGKHIYDIFRPVSDESKIESLMTKIFEGEDHTEEIKILNDDTEYTYIAKTIQTVLADGTPGVTIFFKDITDKNKYIEKIKTVEALYENIISKTSDLVIFADATGIINYVNQSSLEILGYNSKKLEGKNISEILEYNNRKFGDCFAYINSCTEAGEDIKPILFESEFKHFKGQKTILNVYIYPEYITSEKYKGYLILCSNSKADLKSDITTEGIPAINFPVKEQKHNEEYIA